jgi:dCMP deaminase
MTRPSWDEYFIEIALNVAKRSTCNRKQVGCVLVSKNKHIIATGYGGSIKGQPHCTDVGCNIDEKTGGCIRTVHAEMNAIAQAARNGASTEDSTAYTTLSPCYWCFKTLVNAGITRIVYFEEYRIPPPEDEAMECDVALCHFLYDDPMKRSAQIAGNHDVLTKSIDLPGPSRRIDIRRNCRPKIPKDHPMKAGNLVEAMGEALMGCWINTPKNGDYPGGQAVVLETHPDPNAPDIVLQVQRPTYGQCGVFNYEIVSLCEDEE